MDRITEEYLKFRNYILSLKKEDIFERAVKIVFYNELYRYFKTTGACIEKDVTLQSLYMFYIKYEKLNVNDNEEIAEFLKLYKKAWKRELKNSSLFIKNEKLVKVTTKKYKKMERKLIKSEFIIKVK